MVDWHRFIPADFEYDFEKDKLAHHYRVADMSTEGEPKCLSEEQIDEIVIAQADDDTAWEDPISVHNVTYK